MAHHWNYFSGIRRLSLQTFIKGCQTTNDISEKLASRNIDSTTFPWDLAKSLLISETIIEHPIIDHIIADTVVNVEVITQEQTNLEKKEVKIKKKKERQLVSNEE